MKVIARQDDTLDSICWRELGNTDVIEQVCELNPHTLATPILAAGTTITLPDTIAATPKQPTITLWG